MARSRKTSARAARHRFDGAAQRQPQPRVQARRPLGALAARPVAHPSASVEPSRSATPGARGAARTDADRVLDFATIAVRQSGRFGGLYTGPTMDPLSASLVAPCGCCGADFRAACSISAVWASREPSRRPSTRCGFAGLLPS
jgi:hypothetical protein